jgi:hypothetical protein
MKVIRIALILICLLTPALRLSYCQSGLEEDPYYEQFKDKHFTEAKKSGLINFLYIVFSGLIIWFAYYFIAGRNDVGGLKIFYVLIFIAIIFPTLGFYIQVSNLTAKENLTRFSRNPTSTIKTYPLKYGMTQEEVRRKWGNPRESTQGLGGEVWFYCRLEPRVDFRLGGQYWFCHVKGWREVHAVSLVFRGDLLVDSNPNTLLLKNR